MAQKKAFGKVADAATAKAQEPTGEPTPAGPAPGPGGQGTMGTPGAVPAGPAAPPPHNQKPASARTVARGTRKKKP